MLVIPQAVQKFQQKLFTKGKLNSAEEFLSGDLYKTELLCVVLESWSISSCNECPLVFNVAIILIGFKKVTTGQFLKVLVVSNHCQPV